MNPNFISVESLMNQDAPAMDPDNPVPQAKGAPQKSPGNLTLPPPSKNGFITEMVDPDSKKRVYHCSVSFDVMDTEPYYSLIRLLWQAQEGDTVYIDCFSNGGQVEAGFHIIAAILQTPAHVITRAYGLCCSIAAMIWSAGHERQVMDNATIMYHMPSGGVFGKTADNMEESKNIQDWFTEVMREITKGLLTEEELKRIITCRYDFFLPANVVRQRLAAIEGNENASTEQLGSGPIKRGSGKGHFAEYSEENVQDCCPDVPCGQPRRLVFTRDEIANNRIGWTFYLTETPQPDMIRDFVHKMHLPAEEDSVLIHAPSELFIDDAEILASAVQACKAKNIVISAPYVLNSNAAFFATCGTSLVPFPYGIMVIDLPPIAAFGKVIDASNAVAVHKTRILHVLNTLRDRGFIHTEENYLRIVKEQATYCIYGKKLEESVKGANARKNQKVSDD